MDTNYKNEILQIAERFCDEDASNYITAEAALRPDLVGMRIFEKPLLAVAVAADPIFEEMRSPEVIGEYFITPLRWLPSAKSVISMYLPFTEAVVRSNLHKGLPSSEWLHGRIEGQKMLNALTLRIKDYFEGLGYASLVPLLDERFWLNGKPAGPRKNDGVHVPGFTSNWSERHAAFACGLGTFSLSKNLITKKGTAGRFCSLLTAMPLAPDLRPYAKYDEYCSYCGICIDRCPSGAITPEGKNKAPCSVYLDEMFEIYSPRYGCGKCCVGVPCQSGIPLE